MKTYKSNRRAILKQQQFQWFTYGKETEMGRFRRTRGGFIPIISMNSGALGRTHPMDAEDAISRQETPTGGDPSSGVSDDDDAYRFSARNAESMVIFSRRKSTGLERKA
jgi:hypothetical protein